jgi:hypothetical protein
MSRQSINKTSNLKNSHISEELFPFAQEYTDTITAMSRTGILTLLPRSETLGVIGIDGKEYPVPTQEQIIELITHIVSL